MTLNEKQQEQPCCEPLSSQPIPDDPATRVTLRLLDTLFGDQSAGRVSVRLWNGVRWNAGPARSATLVLNHPGALRAMFLPGTEVALGEAYLFDDFDVEGDVEAIFDLADAPALQAMGWRQRLRLGRALLRLPARAGGSRQIGRARMRGRHHSVERDRQAVTAHYDVSNDFYALWLDRRMVYSCAYFQAVDEDIDTAQERKLDYICHKLRLQPGQRLLDVGCGWGGLVIHAARHYGVDATGITLSRPQAELANERIAAQGLADRCRVHVRDYRELDEPDAYDALVSVGMFEHVGAAMLPTYFAQAWRLLKPGAPFLNHGIAATASDQQVWRGPSFSEAYVFPDGELVPINASLRAAEEARFEVRDVESLREHYALTLRRWVRRLEGHHAEALEHVSEPTYRVWRLFMAGSAHGFTSGRLNLYQVLLVKPDEHGRSGLPLTRADWYT